MVTVLSSRFVFSRPSQAQRGSVSRPPMDPYAVLNLGMDASLEDIKKAFRRLAVLHHPGTAVACARPRGLISPRADKGGDADKVGTHSSCLVLCEF
jgi:hypothetical protein